MKNLNKMIDVILLLPVVVWLLNGIFSLLINGLYSYTYLIPLPFKIHTFTLLPITTFYLTTYLVIKPHKPVKNFLIAFLFIFLSMAVYEFVYGIFMINTQMSTPHFGGPPPMHPRFGPFEGSIIALLVGTPLLFFLNRRFHFLTKDRNRILLFLLCFLSFIAVMFILDYTGFFVQADLWLKEQTTKDPHNPLWILSKFLCVWMFFPLLDFDFRPFQKSGKAVSLNTPSKDIDVSIIIPTFNESENIGELVSKINNVLSASKIKGEIIVVDDNSPDGTGKIVQKMKEEYDNVQLVIRKNEGGLSSAVIRGFEEAKGNILCVMDADLSHPSEVIPKLIEPIKSGQGELIIASRYLSGAGVKGWKLKRKVISKGATLLAKFITNTKDPMSGFFALKRSVIGRVELNPKGYKIGLEIIAKGNYSRVIEVPYVFQDRKYGESKLTNKVMREYVAHLFSLIFTKNSLFRQFFKFCVVGAIGTIINLAILYSLVEWLFVWYILAAAIAFGVAVTSNYILNKIWTFHYKTTSASVFFGSYAKFISISIIGLVINLAILYVLVEYFHIWYIFSQIIAIGIATLWNYGGSKTWAFHH